MPAKRPTSLSHAHSMAILMLAAGSGLGEQALNDGQVDSILQSLQYWNRGGKLSPEKVERAASQQWEEARDVFEASDTGEREGVALMHAFLLRHRLSPALRFLALGQVHRVARGSGSVTKQGAQLLAVLLRVFEVQQMDEEGGLPKQEDVVRPELVPWSSGDMDMAVQAAKRLVEGLTAPLPQDAQPRTAPAMNVNRGNGAGLGRFETQGEVHLEVSAREVFGYSLHCAGVPLLDEVAITNSGTEILDSLVLVIRVHSDARVEGLAGFEGQFGPLQPGGAARLRQVALEFDSKLLVQLDEGIAGTTSLEVRSGDRLLASLVIPIRILAYNQWVRVAGIEELLAAHVLPNHPAVERVRSVASDILKRETGSSSQEGYQSGADRAHSIVKATFDALCTFGIRYSDPPSSWEYGQKIRTPEQVLEDRFGTCLDTACLFAACLEQAGLFPAIALIEGHAFTAVWLEAGLQHRGGVLRDRDVVLSLIDGKKLLPVETTFFTEGHGKPFAAAVQEAGRRLMAQPLLGMVDIRVARMNNVQPLPSRVVKDGQVVVIHQDAPAAERTVLVGERRFQPATTPKQTVPARFLSWQADLLDLSLRNPLLNLRFGRGGGVKLIVPKESLREIDQKLAAGDAIALAAADELTGLQRAGGARLASELEHDLLRQSFLVHATLFTEVPQSQQVTRVRALMKQARTVEEESGTNVLHLTLGTAVWKDPDSGKSVRSPFLLMPVRIELPGRGKPPQIRADLGAGTMVNHCLLQKLEHVFGLKVPEVASWRGDAPDADLRSVLDLMRTAIARDKLMIGIEDEATLSLLSFGKFRMWKDLQEYWPRFLQRPVVRHLVESPGQTFVDPVPAPTRAEIDAGTAMCPIPCDGSQLEAVFAAGRGCSFVLEGPPGTGKSQTITNLVANALAQGKKVLFVAEKRAALEVVKSRLHKVGLGVFCLDVHGKDSSPVQIREQLGKSLEAIFQADLEAYEGMHKELLQCEEGLRRYAVGLHEPNALGMSLWSAHQAILAHGEGRSIAIPSTVMKAGATAIAPVKAALRALPETARAADLAFSHPWGFITTASLDGIDLGRIEKAVCELEPAWSQRDTQDDQVMAFADGLVRLEDLQTVSVVMDALASGYRPGPGALEGCNDDGWRSVVREYASILDHVPESIVRLLTLFHATVLDADPKQLADELGKALGSFFLFRGMRVRRAMAELEEHAKADLPEPTRLVEILRKGANSAEQLAQRARNAASHLGMELPRGFRIHAAEDRNRLLTLLRRLGTPVVKDREPAAVPWSSLLAMDYDRRRSLQGLLQVRVASLRSFFELLRVTPDGLFQWNGETRLGDVVRANLTSWLEDARDGVFLGLERWIKLQANLEVLQQAGLGELRTAVLDGSVAPEDALGVLEYSIAKASLAERKQAQRLTRFDGRAHNSLVQSYTRVHSRHSETLAQVVPAQLLAKRPFRPGQYFGQVGNLKRRELTKKRGSIRAIMDEYSDAVLMLTPCVLASPDSVAQFLRPDIVEFDMVVFDEASQVPVADAVGAMGRGKSVIVVGDSRQMPPTTFFKVTDKEQGEDFAEDDGATKDLESILSEAVASGLRRIWLSWHYRSQDESLIAFSNRYYYENRLASFPAPARHVDGKGVAWLRVAGGVFDSGGNRTNRIEAEAVVAEVRRRLHDPMEQQRSLGIVALNLQQSELIVELLEQLAGTDALVDAALRSESEERLFVKNLENVQGDERDVILISLTYAPDGTGHFRMNFGPLNRVGGERRWNVLVTRAKQQVVVVSSIDPEQIQLDRVSAIAKGVSHMKAYLEMARDGVEVDLDLGLRPVEARDMHREDVAEALREKGLHVECNVGLSSFKVDLSVSDPEDPERRLLAILLDGPSYSRRFTVHDRDSLPGTVLKKMMGWPGVHRVWLPEWMLERSRVVEGVVALVKQLKEQPAASALHPNPSKPVSPGGASSSQPVADQDPEPRDPSGNTLRGAGARTPEQEPPAPLQSPHVPQEAEFVPYDVKAKAGTKEDLDDGASKSSKMRVLAVIREVLAVEAPVAAERLAKSVARRFGLKSVPKERMRAVLALVPEKWVRRSSFGEFVWATADQHRTWSTFRRTPEGKEPDRKINEIAPEEILNAIAFCAVCGMGVSDEAAIDEVADLFGFQRVTADIRQRIEAVIDKATKRGKLERDARNRLVLPFQGKA